MGKPLDIPSVAFDSKAEYFERPPRALVDVIKQFIERFGTAHLWPGHSHNKPPQSSRVTFLGKYSLPKTHRRRELWAPCPCCSLRHPKYFRHGLIAWFPDEGILRCVGDKCYKKMDPEGYELAMKLLNAEIEAERTADFLLARIPRIPDYLRVLEHNLPALEAIDTMLNKLGVVLDRVFAIDIWPEVSSGLLRYVVKRSVLRRAADGAEELHTFDDFENYGSISGFTALRSGKFTFAKRLRMKMHNMGTINFGGETAERIAAMMEPDKQKAVKILSYTHSEAQRICREAEEARQLFTPANIATVNGWSEHAGSPVRIHFALAADSFGVAREKSEDHTPIGWPENFWRNIQQLEPLSRGKAA